MIPSEILRLGSLSVDPPVVLAPMAGVTNVAFRRICRRFGAGLYVSEMITARGLMEGNRRTRELAAFAPDEPVRSIQLYGTDPYWLGEATKHLVGDERVDHIDMNFGCPVRKVTSHGGGAAIPGRPRLMARLIAAVVRNAGDVPVTVKFRKGIDDQHLTHLSSGQLAQEQGVAAVGLHARTASQLYAGDADWNAIAELKSHVSIPVLGNGDILEAQDAVRMMSETGCDGVIVGRGCLGRPWLFRDLADVFAGREPAPPPDLGAIGQILLEHSRYLIELLGEFMGVCHTRRHGAWYTKSFPRTGAFRKQLNQATTYADVEQLVATLDADEPFPAAGARVRRAKSNQRQTVSLPHGWLDADPDDFVMPVESDGVAADGG